MYDISGELKDKIKMVNKVLLNKYEEVLSIDREYLRGYINSRIGPILKIDKFTEKELKKYTELGGILGVDGSKNRMGGAHPHFLEVYQGLAKSTLYKDKPIYKVDFYTPLYTEEEEANWLEEDVVRDEKISNKKLAAIEVEAALEGVQELNPYAVMMDGSLIRYKIVCSEKWERLKEECEKRNILLVGVIKDIKTSIIKESIKEDNFLPIKECFHDKELLYGLLDYGEVILTNINTKKEMRGFASLFMRSSQAPTVIGMDILKSQQSHILEMARLVFTLTPKYSRGVPLWLDIIDNEVKIPDQMIRGILESYLDRRIFEMLFVSERDKRTM